MASRKRNGRLASCIISDSRPTRSELAGTTERLGTTVLAPAWAMVARPVRISKVVMWRSFSDTPTPVEALPCGSMSRISTLSPMAASAVPRLMAVVVLPTPPFWLATARTRSGLIADMSILRFALKVRDAGDAAVRIRDTRNQRHLKLPATPGHLQLLRDLSAFGK